jgi:hypothetical protein
MLIYLIKNIAALFILIFIFIISCTTDKNQTSPKILVESRTTKYEYVAGKMDTTGTLYEKIIYDKLERDSIIENYGGNGSLYLRTFLYYDSTGNKIKSVDYKSDGKMESKTEFKYSPDGKLSERIREHVNGGFNRGKFIYNDKGERVKEIWTSKWYFDQSGEWYTSEDILLRSYNENGYCIGVKESSDGKPFKNKKTVFDSLGQIIYEDWSDNFQKYSYDKNGNEIEHLYLDTNQKLVKRWVSIYNTNNVRIEYTTYNSSNESVEVLKKEMIWKKK